MPLGRRRPLPFGRVPGPAAARGPGLQGRPAVDVGYPYWKTVPAGRPGCRGWFVEALLQVVGPGAGLCSDGGLGGRGGQRGLLTGQQHRTVPTVLTLTAVGARFVALPADRLVDVQPDRLPMENTR